MTDWDGVRLGGTPQRVHYLLLTDKDLDGSISPLLGNLTELRRLDLDENSLTGEIPAQLGGLKKLTHLYLQNNSLSGELPPELGQMNALQVLYLEDNGLTGTLPEQLGDLPKLTQLVLAGNGLSGTLPGAIGDIPALTHLVVRDNQLSGQIPRTLSQRSLVNLALSGNSFTGCLPTGLDQAPSNDLFRPNPSSLPTCGPTFGQETYTFTVSADAASGTQIGTISADPYETDGTVTYTIATGNGNGQALFGLNASSGALTLARIPAQGDGTEHTLSVEATDEHGQTSAATVRVTITP